MKKLIILILSLLMICAAFSACTDGGSDDTGNTESTEITSEIDTPAFTGTVDEILDAIINRTADENLEQISAYHNPIGEDEYEIVLGLTKAEYDANIEAAVESKPDGSWWNHSVVVIKVRDGADVAAIADKISKGTSPCRFGCIRAEAVVTAYTGQYIILIASFGTIYDSVYDTVVNLSKLPVKRIDRENDWSGGILGG